MNLEGAYKLVIAIFADQYKKGLPLTITNTGEQRRDFTYVQDVVKANILAATHSEELVGESFNIGNGNNFSINEVADIFGLKTRMSISYIESGKQKISPSIKIACEYLWNQKHNVCICGKR